MNDLIFGKTWSQIQDMQQGRSQSNVISGPCEPSTATESDLCKLKAIGIDGFKAEQLYGIIDRLQTSGIIPTSD